MRIVMLTVACGVVALASCGDDDTGDADARMAAATTPAVTETRTTAKRPPAPRGRTIIAASSEFGRMLYGADKQAIYIFENDRRNESRCYGECARAWPPVFTKGKPRAGRGVRQSLLGTTKRRDGRLQVTYNGRPLYFYVNEDPGEVRCHNVFLNGGLWWVIGPNGRRRA